LQDEEGLVLRGANTFEGMESDDDLEDDSDEFADGLADEDDDSEDIEVRARKCQVILRAIRIVKRILVPTRSSIGIFIDCASINYQGRQLILAALICISALSSSSVSLSAKSLKS
jgi:hypothetical protein